MLKKNKTVSKKRKSKIRNPSGVLELDLLRSGKSDKYYIIGRIGTNIVFKSDDKYNKKTATLLLPKAKNAILTAVKEEERLVKRKNPRGKNKIVSNLLEQDTFDRAIAATQGMPSNPEEAFQLGFIAGLSHGLRYNSLTNFFEKRRVRKRIKESLDASLAELTRATLSRGSGISEDLRRVKPSRTKTVGG